MGEKIADLKSILQVKHLLSFACLAVLIFLYLPIIIMTISSFSSGRLTQWPPPGYTLEWYKTFLQHARALKAVRTSFLIAIGASSLFTAFRESIDNTLKTEDQIKKITNVPVLSSISYIVTDSEKRIKRLKILGWIFFICIAISSGLYFVDQYIIHLEDIWSILLERIKMIA